MYNLVFGKSVAGDTLLTILGVKKSDFYRFRDCYLSEDREIAVYTRGGGGNRECYCEVYSISGDEYTTVNGEIHSLSCVVSVQSANRAHPCYLHDDDDEFDNTYATFYFRIPDEADRSELAKIEPEIDRNTTWLEFLEALKSTSSLSPTEARTD